MARIVIEHTQGYWDQEALHRIRARGIDTPGEYNANQPPLVNQRRHIGQYGRW